MSEKSVLSVHDLAHVFIAAFDESNMTTRSCEKSMSLRMED